MLSTTFETRSSCETYDRELSLETTRGRCEQAEAVSLWSNCFDRNSGRSSSGVGRPWFMIRVSMFNVCGNMQTECSEGLLREYSEWKSLGRRKLELFGMRLDGAERIRAFTWTYILAMAFCISNTVPGLSLWLAMFLCLRSREEPLQQKWWHRSRWLNCFHGTCHARGRLEIGLARSISAQLHPVGVRLRLMRLMCSSVA